MKRRAYGLLLGVAILTGGLAVIAGRSLGMPVHDPEGFLGPSWLRLPLLCLGAFLIDVVPRAAWRSRRRPRAFAVEARALIAEHWTRERVRLVVLGMICFYVTYVSYRNLKGFLPFIREVKYDAMLRDWDRALFFGNYPAVLLHDLLGQTIAAHLLSWAYLIFLPFVPISVVAWVVWSRNITFGYWYVTAQCLCWALGTASYYALPTLGPAFASVWLFRDLEPTGVTALQATLFNGRADVRFNPLTDTVQSIAGFASLHVAITLCAALIAHYTVGSALIRRSLWVFFALTIVSTIYFGWHYVADDVAGVAIAIVAVWLSGLATGQKFQRGGRASQPTSSTARVPISPG